MPKRITREKQIWDYLVSKFGNQYAAAGIMGNMWCDSQLAPKNYKGNKNLDYETLSCSWKEFAKNDFGFGLLNWTWWAAKLSMYNLAKRDKERGITDLYFQLDFLWNDLNCLSYQEVVDDLKKVDTVDAAAEIFFEGYCKENNNRASYYGIKERREFARCYFVTLSRGTNQRDCIGKYAKITGNKAVKLKNSPSFLGKSIGLFCIPGNEYKVLAVSKNGDWCYVCHMEKQGWIPSRFCEIYKKSGGVEYDEHAVS